MLPVDIETITHVIRQFTHVSFRGLPPSCRNNKEPRQRHVGRRASQIDTCTVHTAVRSDLGLVRIRPPLGLALHLLFCLFGAVPTSIEELVPSPVLLASK